jgi:hypothetical protein
MKLHISLTLPAFLLSGCASTELNYNTLDIASGTDSLLTRQTLYNLSNFLDSETALPAQIVVSSGTETTADTVTGSVTAPLSKTLTGTTQVLNTASSSPSVATTNLATAVKAGASLTAGGTDVHTQNYSFQLISDAYQLWRLKALYRFAVDEDESKFVNNFPLLYKTVSQQRTACLRDKSRNNANVYGTAATPTDPNSGLPGEPFKSCITQLTGPVGGTGTPTMTMAVGQDTFSILKMIIISPGQLAWYVANGSVTNGYYVRTTS